MEYETEKTFYGLGEIKKHEQLKTLAESLRDISLRNLKRWIKGEMSPIGINAVNLRFGLYVLGYQVKEVDKLSPQARRLGICYIQSDFTFQAMSDELNIPRQALFDFLLSKELMGKERSERVLRFIEKYDVIEKVKIEEDIPPPDSPIQINTVEEDIEMFIYLMSEIAPLAKRILSDKVSPAERRKMREDLGRERLFEISNHIDCLCSERAREKLILENRGRR